MKYICPLIAVTDLEKSRYFYESILGQKVKIDYGENVTFHGDFAIHLATHFKELIDNKEIRHGGNNFEFYFEYDDLEETIARLKEEGVQFVHEMREQPWRQRVVRIYDPDKNIIEIGESLEFLFQRLKNGGMTIEQVAEATGMDVEFVKNALNK